MTTSRLTVLFAVLLFGLSTVMLLPKQLRYQPAGIELHLPETAGGWTGHEVEVSQREITILGAETDFARKVYKNKRGDEVTASIVLSGQDMNTSIHRPERCLPAQGWTIADKQSVGIPVAGFGTVPTTCLHNLRNVAGENNKPVTVHHVSYYWFAGHTSLTASHLDRTIIDIRDRILRGYNQRWAYITVSAIVTKNLQPRGLSEEETCRIIEDFIAEIVPAVHKDTLKKS